MINLFNSNSKLKPNFNITSSNYCELIGQELKTYGLSEDEIIKADYAFQKFIDSFDENVTIPVYIFNNPDHFKDIIIARHIDLVSDEGYLPNYRIKCIDTIIPIYSEDVIDVGVSSQVIRQNVIITNNSGGYFNKDKLYAVHVSTAITFKTTRIDINNSTQSNIYLYVPKARYFNN